MGLESLYGVGGGTISREAQKNLDKAEDLCRKKKPEKAIPFLMKALEDPNNLDAAVQLAFVMPNMDMSLNVLEDTEKKGRAHLLRTLGPDAFDDNGDSVGYFWGLIETRPYMRVLQAIIRVSFEKGDFAKSANTIAETLRLCPGDNMGQRDWMGSVLMKAGRSQDALSFCQAWTEPETMRTGTPPPLGGCKFDPPSQTPLSQERLGGFKYCESSLIYPAALAAFKLWGDCELARQYLKLAAELNPHVLRKILARAEQPAGLNHLPRTPNGPEQGHDYLWLTQDLWMVPDVWAWADGDVAKEAVLKTCSRPGCGRRETTVAQFKCCGACKDAVYCGQECQKKDWKAHKPKCQERRKLKDTIRAMQRPRSTG